MVAKTVPQRAWRRLTRVCFVVMVITLLVLNLASPAKAAITPGNSTNANSGANAITIARPSDTVAGDVLVACIITASASGSIPSAATPPDGWQLIQSTDAFQDWYYNMATYYKVAGPNEPASYTWTSGVYFRSGGITRLTGVDINRVVDVCAEAQGSGSGQVLPGNQALVVATAPTVTTAYNNDIVVSFFGSHSALTSFAEVGDPTPLYEYTPPKSGSYDPPSIAAYSWTQASAGATGARSCGLTSATTPVRWVAQTVAFKAAPTVSFQYASSSVAEGTNRQVNLVLSSASDGPVTVNFAVSGTATATSDYTVTASPYTIPAGSTTGYLYIHSLQDNLYEVDDNVVLTITGASGAIATGTTTHTHTITDDDSPAPTPVIAAGDSQTGVSPQTTTYPPPLSDQVIRVNKPDGLQVGDLMLAAISWHSTPYSSPIVPHEGWVPIRTTYYNGIRVSTYYKIANATDVSASVIRYLFGIPADDLNWGYHATGGITRYTGVDTTHPIDVSDAAFGNVAYGGTISAPSVNPNYSNDRIVTVFGTYHPVQNISTPSGMTERYEVHYHIDPSNSLNLIWPEIAVSDMTWAPASGTGAKTATVTANSPTPIGSGSNWAAQTIALKSLPQLNFLPTSSGGSEAATTVNLPVYLSSPNDGPVTVNYAVNAAGTTAKSGTDYNLTSGTLTFAAGEVTKNVVLHVVNDKEYENSETVQVTLSSPSGAVLGANAAYTYTITDNDSNPADAIVYQNSNGSNGGIGGVSNHLLGIGKPAGTTTGDFLLACIANRTDFANVSVTPPEGWTLIGTAINGPTRVTTFYRFAGTSPGTDPAIYGFTIGTSVYEYEDHATGTIVRYTGVDPSNPVDVWAGAGASSSTAIAPSVHPSFDNGRLVTVFGSYVPVSFGTPAGMNLLNYVHYHTGDVWPVETWPATYVFDQVLDPASQAGTRTSVLTQFGDHYGQWTALSLVLHDAQPAISINANAPTTTEAGGTTAFTVRLSSQPSANVTVGLSSTDVTEGTISPASLTFTTTNWNSPQAVTVTGVDDSIDDGDIAYAINLTASSADAGYHGKTASVGVTNRDNDVTVSFNANGGSPTPANLVVATGGKITRPADPTKSGYALDGWYTDNNAFTDKWDFNVDTVGTSSFTLYAKWLVNPTMSINDVSQLEGNSGNTNMVFTVTLSAASPRDVTVSYATGNGSATAGSDYTSSVGTLMIIAGQTTGTISVPIIGDTTYEPDETFYVNLANANGATIADAQGFGTIQNDDPEGTPPVISVNPVDQTVTYGDNASFTATASGSPSPTVQWQVSTDGGNNFSDISDGGIYSGATTNTLSLTRPTVVLGGYKYRAVFTNGISPAATSSVATLTVAQLDISGSFTAESKVYDGTTAATVLSRSLVGALSGDNISLTGGTATFADKHAGIGKTVTLCGAVLSGTDAPNYRLTSVATATAAISAKPVTPSIVANDKQYDGTTAATLSSQTVSGVIAPDDVILVVGQASFADKNVGSWTVTATALSLGGTDAGNYTLLTDTATDTANITAVNLTISGAVAQNKIYDGNDTATVDFTQASLEGVIGNDSVSINSSGYSATFNDKNVGAAKSVTVHGVTLSGIDASNYTLTQPVGLTADITALDISGSFTADDKVYDGTAAATVLSRSLVGALSGDNISLTGGTASFADRHAGIGKTVTLSGAVLSGTDAANYRLTSVATATAAISAKPVTPSIVANDKQYDGTTAATLSSQTISGVIAPDVVTLVVGGASFADKNVGIWTVTATALSLGGTDAGNYTLSTATATDTANITAVSLTISGAVAQNKIYDGQNTATVDFTQASPDGVIGNDSVSINSTGYSATFNDKNVGAAKSVTVHGVTLSGIDASNYTLTQPVGLTADITQLEVSGSFTADDKVYDGTAAATVLSRSLVGALSGDSVSLTGGTASFADRHAGIGKTVTLSGAVLSGTDAANYHLTSVATATAEILARAITVTAVTDTKVYDGSTSSDETPVVTSELGLAVGDTAIWTQEFDTKDAGIDRTLTPGGTVTDGNDGANYQVTFAPISTGVIEKAMITVTAENKSSQYSDPMLPLTATFSGFVSGETFATSGIAGSPSYITVPALSNPIMQAPGSYSIVPDKGSLAADNYDFGFVNGVYTVTEEKATLTLDSQNPVAVKVASDGGNNDAFIWRVAISQDDHDPGDMGEISKSDIVLSFSPVGGGSGWSGAASSFDPVTGIASFRVPADVLSVETYSAQVSLNSDWFDAPPAEDVLVVYDPSLGFTTGGGWFYWPAGTSNPELQGVKTNFGYTIKYNRKGTNVQGNLLLIAHLPDGSTIRIKSNAIYGLAIINNTYPGVASFSGKCVYSRVDANGNILAEAGNQDFTVYVQDMNEPGTGTDMFWFTTKLTIAGEDPFSLDSNSNRKADEAEYVALGGGNILVPHTANSSEATPPEHDKKK